MSKNILLNLNREIFRVEPDERFAEELHVPKGLWKEIWYRYKWLSYTPGECREYYYVKTLKPLGAKTFYRWAKRTEVYFAAQPLIKKNYETINSVFFGELEDFLCPDKEEANVE